MFGRKIITTFLVSAASLALVAGCSNGNAHRSEGSNRVAILTYTRKDEFTNNLVNSMKESAENKGLSADVYNSESDGEKQIRQVKKAVGMHYKAILIRPVDADNAQEITAIAGDIPVVFFNLQPDRRYLKADNYVYVGPKEETAGRMQADYILKHTSKQSLNVAVLRGQSGLASEKRTSSFKEALQKSGRTVNYVFNDYADWNEDTAEHQTEMFLKTGQTCDVLVANNDNMALGALKAFRKEGRKLPVICGIDASTEAEKSISRGQMSFTVRQPYKIQGEKCIETALAMSRGKQVTDIKGSSADGCYVYTGFTPVSEDDLR